MNYARFITAKSAARKPSTIRVMSESELCPSPMGWKWGRGCPQSGSSLGELGSTQTWHRNRAGIGARAVNQQQREARSRSWLESRGLFWHRSQGSATACRRVQSGEGGYTGQKGVQGAWQAGRGLVEEGFLSLWPLLCLGDQSAFSVARVDSSVPPLVRSVHTKSSSMFLSD